MSTSNSYSYTESTQSIVYDAMSFLGRIGDGETPTDGDYALAVRTLNRLSKSIQLKNDRASGMKLWKRQEGFLFLSPSSGTYTLSANPNIAFPGNGFFTNDFTTTYTASPNPPGNTVINLTNAAAVANGNIIGITLDDGGISWANVTAVGASTVNVDVGLASSANQNNVIYTFSTFSQPPQLIDWVNLRDSNGNDINIDRLTYEEFVALPSKQSPLYQGDPVAVYYETHLVGNAGQGYGLLSTDVNGSSDLSKYLVLDFVVEIQDWVDPADEPDFPKEWFMALVYSLAKHLAPHFNAPWTQTQEDLYKAAIALAQSANPKRLAYSFSRRGKSGSFRNPPHR